MLADVFRKSLRDQRRGLLGWGVGVVALVAVMAALWPAVRDMFDQDLFAAYPEAIQRLFDISEMATGAGFLNAELFSIILPAMFIVYGIGRGARTLAGEEQEGTLEVVVVSPVSRTRILLDKAAALAVGLTALGAVLFAVIVVSSAVAGMGIPAGHALVGSAAMVLIGVQHAWLALAVGAATGRKGPAIAVPGTLAVMGYVLHVVGALVDAVEPWQRLSPFTQAIAEGPIGSTVPMGFAWLALTAVAVLLASLPLFDRRDMAAA